jgi:glycosyltransferase involved in cell wall biosynthesis
MTVNPAKIRLWVLLPTFNGGNFLDEQFQSLADQTLPPTRILVRDDGSSDQTLAIISAWQDRLPISLVDTHNDHCGLLQSIQRLLAAVPPDDIDAIAFCDQDDVWHPRKLEWAMSVLVNYHHTPALYCASATLTDPALNDIGKLPYPPRGPDFPNALVENIATGCTSVLNRRAVQYLQSPWPSGVLLHDWWAYLVISAVGNVIYDPRPVLSYRQHGRNMVGASASKWRQWQQRWRRFCKKNHRMMHPLRQQATALAEYLGDRLPYDRRPTLEQFLALKPWRRQECPVWRQSPLDHCLMRMMIFLGYL